MEKLEFLRENALMAESEINRGKPTLKKVLKMYDFDAESKMKARKVLNPP